MNTDTPTQESLDEIKKQIAQAIEEKEGDFIALAEQIEQIENEAMEKFDKDCMVLDAWFAEESGETKMSSKIFRINTDHPSPTLAQTSKKKWSRSLRRFMVSLSRRIFNNFKSCLLTEKSQQVGDFFI